VSSTKKKRADRGHDFYETPAWCVRALVPHLPAASRALDPAAGTGAILGALLDTVPAVSGFEIDQAHQSADDIVYRDALSPEPWGVPPLVVMNPPFALAEEFVRRALAEVTPGGSVFALLRLAFLEGQKRVAFHAAHPADVLVLPRRPSFTGRGTDSSAYAWFVWGPGRGGRWQILTLPHGDDR